MAGEAHDADGEKQHEPEQRGIGRGRGGPRPHEAGQHGQHGKGQAAPQVALGGGVVLIPAAVIEQKPRQHRHDRARRREKHREDRGRGEFIPGAEKNRAEFLEEDQDHHADRQVQQEGMKMADEPDGVGLFSGE